MKLQLLSLQLCLLYLIGNASGKKPPQPKAKQPPQQKPPLLKPKKTNHPSIYLIKFGMEEEQCFFQDIPTLQTQSFQFGPPPLDPSSPNYIPPAPAQRGKPPPTPLSNYKTLITITSPTHFQIFEKELVNDEIVFIRSIVDINPLASVGNLMGSTSMRETHIREERQRRYQMTADQRREEGDDMYGYDDDYDNEIVEGIYGDYEICLRSVFESKDGKKKSEEDVETGVYFTFVQSPHGEPVESNAMDLDNKEEVVVPLKKHHLEPLQTLLQSTIDMADKIKAEALYMSRRELRMHRTSESTLSRIFGFGVIGVVVLIVFGVAQVFVVKNFFKRKKLL